MALRAEVAVVGLGAMGSAATLALARRGVRVVGLDQLVPPHTLGSSHGRSRIIREAYFESPVYVPLVRRAYELWEALERDGGRRLLWRTGGLMLGPPDGEVVGGARRSAELHQLPFETLGAAEIRRRFPVFAPAEGDVGILEARAGFLDPEACVGSALALAVRAGAEVRTGVMVASWRPGASGLTLATSLGALECDTAIVAAGPWTGTLLADAGLPLTVERQVMFWFRPKGDPARFAAERLPVFIWEWEKGRMFYGVPDHGAGFKVAPHHEGDVASAETVERLVQPAEIAAMRRILARTIPDGGATLADALTCLYTNTPDRHFVLDRHPGEPRLIIASPCSGHGFKFASAIGEVLADLATNGSCAFDLTPFRAGRFAASGASRAAPSPASSASGLPPPTSTGRS